MQTFWYKFIKQFSKDGNQMKIGILKNIIISVGLKKITIKEQNEQEKSNKIKFNLVLFNSNSIYSKFKIHVNFNSIKFFVRTNK
ncbi:hypothetical protein BpHYR1_053779 [Brachionus plicatilis]|uniref:Uncharacterized protein n=1 Tax=Brachionus plicatilis TaxID=10195 RepID=A0A3M7RAE8_BRAPC|nr:hypothetical protein BpHYR1_053779 [Brachionus plicatilis]